MVAAGTGEGNRADCSSSAVDVSLKPSPSGKHVNVTLQKGGAPAAQSFAGPLVQADRGEKRSVYCRDKGRRCGWGASIQWSAWSDS